MKISFANFNAFPVWILVVVVGTVLKLTLFHKETPELYWIAARPLPVNHQIQHEDLRLSSSASGSSSRSTDSIIGYHLKVRLDSGAIIHRMDCRVLPLVPNPDNQRVFMIHPLPYVFHDSIRFHDHEKTHRIPIPVQRVRILLSQIPQGRVIIATTSWKLIQCFTPADSPSP